MTQPRSSLVSHLAASSALLAAVIVLLAVFFFQLFHGRLYEQAFDTPLEEWSGMLANAIGHDQSIAQSAARRHRLGIIVEGENGTIAFDHDGRETTAAALMEDTSKSSA